MDCWEMLQLCAAFAAQKRSFNVRSETHNVRIKCVIKICICSVHGNVDQPHTK